MRYISDNMSRRPVHAPTTRHNFKPKKYRIPEAVVQPTTSDPKGWPGLAGYLPSTDVPVILDVLLEGSDDQIALAPRAMRADTPASPYARLEADIGSLRAILFLLKGRFARRSLARLYAALSATETDCLVLGDIDQSWLAQQRASITGTRGFDAVVDKSDRLLHDLEGRCRRLENLRNSDLHTGPRRHPHHGLASREHPVQNTD